MSRALSIAMLLVAVAGTGASAQEMVEVPNAPPPSPPPGATADECCVVVEAPPPPKPPGAVLFDVSLGPTYRRAFKEDFAAAALELEIGGQTPSWGIAGRLHADLGATRVGLPYQLVTIGPSFAFRATERLRLGFGVSFGSFSYQRVSAARTWDPTVWALTIGVDLDATVDLVRTARGGALFLAARVGWDFIDNTGDDALSTGTSLALTAALGYRY